MESFGEANWSNPLAKCENQDVLSTFLFTLYFLDKRIDKRKTTGRG